jgi:DNA-binding winged helix-turn-helix (wHTH) protein/Tol biopolymer transport system component
MPRFGPFEVDFTTSELRKSGTRVRIQEQPLRILETLLATPGEIVTREELRDRLWPSGTFVDFDGSLNAAVGKLRQSLNDSADRPRYIETVARKGYRFIGSVTEPESAVRPHVPEPEPPRSQPVSQPAFSAGPRTWRWVAGAVVAISLALLWAARITPQRDVASRVVLLELDVGTEVSQPVISPDGSTVGFIAGGRLAVRHLDRPLDRPKITPLAGTEGASWPFFSPDGKWVGYFANHELRKVAVEGGESVTLCSAPLDRGGTWTESGQIIAALSSTGELSVIPAAGGTPRPFSDFKGEPPEVTNHRMPVALPKDKGVLFLAGNGTSTGALRVLRPGGGPAKTLIASASTARYLSSGYLLFVQGETMFAAPMDLDRLELTGRESPVMEGISRNHFRGADFDVSASGTLVYRAMPPIANRVVAWLDSSGAETRIFSKAGLYASPRLSRDGKRLTLTSGKEVWFYDLAKKTTGRLPFVSETRCCPIWTPDGEYVAFSSLSALAWTRWDASGPVERMTSVRGSSAVPFSFSRDGKWLAFHRNEAQTGYDLWAAPVDRTGGAMRLGTPQLLLKQAGLQAAPAISPNGRWLAYGSDDETGRMEVYIIPFSPQGSVTGRKWQVSTEGGRGPRWSYNGDEIFFRQQDETLAVATAKVAGDSFQPFNPRVWSAKRLANTGPFPNFDTTPDGKRVIAILDATETKRDDTQLQVLLNLDSELRRQRSSPRKAQ